MKKLYVLCSILFVSVLVAAGCCSNGGCPASKCSPCKCDPCKCAVVENAEQADSKIKLIGTDELSGIVEGKKALIFDARSGKWDDGERIPGAKSLNEKSSPEEISAAIPDKNAELVVYCSNTQCPASDRLAKHLLKHGYNNIKEYPEGIDGWRKAGKPVEKIKK